MDKLLKVMRKLRSKSGCPWDRKQTLDSLRRCLLEEAHEVLEAISLKNKHKIEEELGDLLVVISMLIAMGEEKKLFSKKTILKRAISKMISRHPHVFGNKKAKSAEEAFEYWTAAKMQEKKRAGEKSILEDLSYHYPSLLLAYKFQRKVARVGFDWKKAVDVVRKIEEELRELKAELKTGKKPRVKEELGDFLFSAVNLARKLNIDPEIALKDAVRKFKKRFLFVEKQVRSSGRDWKDYQLAELEEYWNSAKKHGKMRV
ncbi:MAG: nucleoside triphosphate pyrophosphohydrolase [Candidatus Omnitrophica bacterium]|nr:nucleoside triphosphate pyrophosphohydrolase [Candidatus Omnitrophota bacterium]